MAMPATIMLRTPSYFDVDSAISRTFKATERVNVDLAR